MTVSYDSRYISAHSNDSQASVFLMNEAPGPDEATSGIPLFGQQGANLFHAFRNARIDWAISHQKFTWPQNDLVGQDERHRLKLEFLALRAKYLTCTNSYPYWPKPKDNSSNFCQPLKSDILSDNNIERIRGEICSHSVILICGVCAYLACVGEELSQPSKCEGSELTQNKIQIINERLNSNFQKGWYMGHTRRWSMNIQKTTTALRALAKFLSWPIS
jgi:hypothetical protein